ncbi:MAG: 1-acyl-sn-glycerol-3-phosphate acyltransferase [Acidobacteria bacterium]|nr:MAG: 1-acyl-sn-glycerol-3-phosphate acyltransferase [Acidobacteriota bacterium]
MTTNDGKQKPDKGPGALATLVATIGGNVYILFGTIVCAIVAILVSWIPPRGNWTFFVARIWSRGLLASSGVRLEVDNETPLDPNRPSVYMSNHQSLYDIPALTVSLPGQTRFLAKRSLFRIPIFGWSIKAGGFISIDREDRSKAREAFAAAVQRLQAGSSAMVFPEGTRSEDGSLGPFQRGGFLLALKGGLPIVPVGISGSLAVQPKGSHIVRPGRITLRYGRPIDAAEYGLSRKRELEQVVRGEIARLAGLEEPSSLG